MNVHTPQRRWRHHQQTTRRRVPWGRHQPPCAPGLRPVLPIKFVCLMNANWPDFWAAVDRSLGVACLRPTTRRVYRRVLRAFRADVDRHRAEAAEPCTPFSISPEAVRDYLTRQAARGHVWSTLGTDIAVLRTIFDKLCGLALTEGLRTPKRRRPLHPVLRPEEVIRLLGAARTSRDRLLVGLLYSGLKVGEVCRLRVSDVASDSSRITVSTAGGTRTREVPLPLNVRLLLDAETPFLKPGAWLFPGARPGAPITTRTVERMVQRTAERAGVSTRVSPMTLRHSFAVQSLRDGNSIRELQEILGHQWLDTTLQYERYLLPTASHHAFTPRHPSPPAITLSTCPFPQWTRGP